MTCYGKVNFAPAENIGFEHKEKVELHMQFRIFRGDFHIFCGAACMLTIKLAPYNHKN